MRHEYPITGMTCGGCEASVQRALSRIPGIRDVKASHIDGTVTFESETQISPVVIESHLPASGKFKLADGAIAAAARAPATIGLKTFQPLIIMFGVVLAWSFLWGGDSFHNWMRHFMGGFFLLFGGLKVVNLQSFAAMFSTYDIIAKRFPAWGYAYAFVEVGLGVLFTLDWYHTGTNIATAVLMSVGTVGIVQKLRAGSVVTCACLGGFFSVPLTWVTVAENMLMAVMAVWMLFLH